MGMPGSDQKDAGMHGDDAGNHSEQNEQPGEAGSSLAAAMVDHVVIVENGTPTDLLAIRLRCR